jgi:hypothetical protein
MRGEVVPSVDPDDFKKVWDVRNSVIGNLIDIEIYRNLCKPDTDAKATIVRANFLFTLTRTFPDKFANIMERGQLNDEFLSTFANIPLIEGEDVNVEKLLQELETVEQAADQE